MPPPATYPGSDLGLPQTGPGSVASVGQRLSALGADVLLVVALSLPITLLTKTNTGGWLSTGLLALLMVVGEPLTGRTPGKALVHIRVRRARWDARPGFGWTVFRTVLMFLVVPALLFDQDRRGLHDRAADVVLVATR